MSTFRATFQAVAFAILHVARKTRPPVLYRIRLQLRDNGTLSRRENGGINPVDALHGPFEDQESTK